MLTKNQKFVWNFRPENYRHKNCEKCEEILIIVGKKPEFLIFTMKIPGTQNCENCEGIKYIDVDKIVQAL